MKKIIPIIFLVIFLMFNSYSYNTKDYFISNFNSSFINYVGKSDDLNKGLCTSNRNIKKNDSDLTSPLANNSESKESILINNKSPESDYNPTQLVQNVLITGCLQAENIEYGGDLENGIGYFESGSSAFPLKSGIIMSTGKVEKAVGPNINPGTWGVISSHDNTDFDVKKLTRQYTGYDVQVLEFDFVPAGDKVEFRYVFASEEYPEFSFEDYKDVFGFILSGPGIEGDYSNNGKNIALLPNGDIVSIDKVNSATNSSYYVEKDETYDVEYDARTTVLTAKSEVIPCQKYHIRLIIADVEDRFHDSAVFIEAESFKSNEISISNGIGLESDIDLMYEGCSGSFIKFSKEEDDDSELHINLNIESGTAVNGVDFIYTTQDGEQIGDGMFPTTIVIPEDKREVRYYYKALKDQEIEGNETFRLSFLKGCPCSDPILYEKEIKIIDVPEIKAVPSSLVSCEGATPEASIFINLQDQLNPGDYQYSIDGGAFQKENYFKLFNPAVGSEHEIIVKDQFSCGESRFNITIPPLTQVAANAGDDQSICKGETIQLHGEGGIVYKWSSNPENGIDYLSDQNIANPIVNENIPTGIYQFTLRVQESDQINAVCIDTDQMQLEVKENSSFTIAADRSEYCSREDIQLTADVENLASDDSFQWKPIDAITESNIKNTSASIKSTSLTTRDFSLEISKSNGCKQVQYIRGIIVHPEPIVEINLDNSIICVDNDEGSIELVVSGGTIDEQSDYTYKWEHDIHLKSNQAINLKPDIYAVEVVDDINCSTKKIIKINKAAKAKRILHF